MALRFSGQADWEGHHRLHSRSTIFPEWCRDPMKATPITAMSTIMVMVVGTNTASMAHTIMVTVLSGRT